jgi:hypothetical protein
MTSKKTDPRRMSSATRVKCWFFSVFLVVSTLAGGAEPRLSPLPSRYAPAADLLTHVDATIARVRQTLSDAADYDLADQSRTLKDAQVLVALAQVLSVHDEAFAERPAMPRLRAGAEQLAASEDNHARAAAALAEISAARSGQAAAGAAARWEKSASLPILMKQVPLIHAGLKRSVDADRWRRQSAACQGQAAALAAIAAVSALDHEYAKTPGETARWDQLCGEMRDAAGAIGAALKTADRAALAEGMSRLHVSCETCHATFRRP